MIRSYPEDPFCADMGVNTANVLVAIRESPNGQISPPEDRISFLRPSHKRVWKRCPAWNRWHSPTPSLGRLERASRTSLQARLNPMQRRRPRFPW